MRLESNSGRSFIRPIYNDRIQYLFISERPAAISYEIPDIFISNWLYLLNTIPKSIFQVSDPLNWHSSNTKYGFSNHINFSIVFDDYPLEEYDDWFQTPHKIIIIFLNTKNPKIFNKIERLERSFLIASDNKNICSSIKKSNNLKARYFDNLKTLFDKITDLFITEFDIDPTEFFNLVNMRRKKSKQILKSLGLRAVPNFLASGNNIASIHQLLSLEKPDLLKMRATAPEERINKMLEVAGALMTLSQQLKLPNPEDPLQYTSPPTLILSYPYFNPDHQKTWKEIFDVKALDSQEAKKIAKKFRKLRFIEQDIDTYNYILNDLEENDSDIESTIINQIFLLKSRHTRFLDFVGYLHSSFSLSPYIRVPARGVSLNNHLSRLSPSQFKKTHNRKSIRKNLFQIGKTLCNNLSNDVVNFIKQYVDSIFVISDLPLEWLLIQDTPLAFLCDICRIPETASTSILSQFNTNCNLQFSINEDILENTLVVCGATSDDPIYQTYKYQIGLHRHGGVLPYKTAHVQSKEEFFTLVNELKPHLLVVDSHGNYKSQTEGSYIYIGDDKVTGDDVVKNLPHIPLVILSCCWGTPIYGNSNTIAQAFFERGCFSVLSTFLPISINSGFTLYFRILGNLAYASQHKVHESWMGFISHNIRTSYLNDLVMQTMEKFGQETFLEGDIPHNLRRDWLLKSTQRMNRHRTYNEAQQMVLGCVRDSDKPKVERFLKSNNYIPEFMLYTHLGRGDLVKFTSWDFK